jgi:hypothetical protein
MVPLMAFLAFAWKLVIESHSQDDDAASRLANGYYAFFGRDPHLAAIGFVWQPLTSVSEMPLFLFRGIWPDLTRLAFDANIMSSLFMAGAAYQLYRFFEDLGLGVFTRWFLLLGMVANPIIFDYGADGMSEALFIFTLIATTRFLARWLETGRTKPLLLAAVWLGLAYGDRNEAAAAALFGTILVFAVSYYRGGGTVRARRYAALTDSVLFAAPFTLVFLGWAVTSYLIVGEFFEQFSSIYGNASQLAVLNAGHVAQSHSSAFVSAVAVTLAFAPVYPLVLVFGFVRMVKSRDLRFLAILAVAGAVVAFEISTYTLGQLAHQERYFIYSIPFLIMSLAYVFRPLPKSSIEQAEERVALIDGRSPRYLGARRRQRELLSAMFGLCAVVMTVPGMFTTYHEMFHTSFGSEEELALQYVLYPGTHLAKVDPYTGYYPAVLGVARMLDDLRTRRGGIMVDNFSSCIPQVITASTNPAEFTIPNDQDWLEKFGVPYQFGIRYMIVPDPKGLGNGLDALNSEYPTLYATGDGFAVRQDQFSIPACNTFRLFRLLPGRIPGGGLA